MRKVNLENSLKFVFCKLKISEGEDNFIVSHFDPISLAFSGLSKLCFSQIECYSIGHEIV